MTNERDGRVRPYEDSETIKNKEEVLASVFQTAGLPPNDR